MRERDAATLAGGEASGAKHRVVLEDANFICFVPHAALSVRDRRPFQLTAIIA